MPMSPKQICQRCGKAYRGKCSCKPVRQPENRKSARERGYTTQWAAARLLHLAKFPLCVMCEKEGRLEAATVVDHIEPHKGDWGLFWATENWQSLCAMHHNRKTRQGL